MKIRDLLADSTLQQKKILEKLLCYYTSISKEDIFTSYEKELTKEQYNNIITGYNAYTKDKKPLEFILGFVEFFQRKFTVDGRCLIPRPETEYMIQAVNEYIAEKTNSQKQANNSLLDTKENCPTTQKSLLIRGMDPDKSGLSLSLLAGQLSQRLKEQEENHDERKNILLDVGTGCGVLGLSVLLENPGFFSQAYLTEYYSKTLQLAKENVEHYADQLCPNPDCIESNLVAFMQEEQYKNSFENSDITLVANLPYIPDETFDTQTEDNVRKWEPRPAFVGGNDGLDFYREMFTQIFDYRNEHKTNDFTMFLEMMTRQVDILRQEFGDRIDFDEIKTFHFNIRIVKGTVR